MKFISVSTLILSSVTLAFASEVRLTMNMQGKPVGVATVSFQKVGANYRVATDLRTTVGPLNTFGGSGIVRADGTPISSHEVRQSPSGKQVYDLTFGASSVILKTTKGGKTTTKTLPYPKSGSIKRSAQLWFIETKPKAGAVEVAWKVDVEKQEWEKTTTKYIGDQQIVVHGKRVTAHVIEQEGGRMFSDDHGMPYRIDVSKGITLERN